MPILDPLLQLAQPPRRGAVTGRAPIALIHHDARLVVVDNPRRIVSTGLTSATLGTSGVYRSYRCSSLTFITSLRNAT